MIPAIRTVSGAMHPRISAAALLGRTWRSVSAGVSCRSGGSSRSCSPSWTGRDRGASTSRSWGSSFRRGPRRPPPSLPQKQGWVGGAGARTASNPPPRFFLPPLVVGTIHERKIRETGRVAPVRPAAGRVKWSPRADSSSSADLPANDFSGGGDAWPRTSACRRDLWPRGRLTPCPGGSKKRPGPSWLERKASSGKEWGGASPSRSSIPNVRRRHVPTWLQTIYEHLNRLPRCCGERVYLPGSGGHRRVRANRDRAFTLESQRPLAEFT